MRKRRPEAILDVYNLVLGAALFVSPWLFAFSQGAASIDARLGGAAIVAASIAALLVFAEWEEWIALLAGLWMVASPSCSGSSTRPQCMSASRSASSLHISQRSISGSFTMVRSRSRAEQPGWAIGPRAAMARTSLVVKAM